MVITHSVLDTQLLTSAVNALAAVETSELEALYLESGEELVPCTVTLTRHPVIQGHFYSSGIKAIDVRVESADALRESRIMMGGGFYTGWPVTLEIDQPGSTEDLRFGRAL